jgi:O-antigen/teichoic acid export membrane protein
MSTSRQVLRNSALNFIAGFSQRIGQTIIFILVARLLTAEDTGSYKLALTFTSITLTFSLWGLDQLLIREVAKDKSRISHYLGNFSILRFGLAIMIWLLFALILQFLPYSAETKQFLLIMTVTIIPASLSNLYQSVWVALEDMKLYTVILLVFSIIRLAGGAYFLLQQKILMPVAYVFLIVAIAEMVTNAWITHRLPEVTQTSWHFDFSFIKHNLRIALPLIAISFILVVEYQFDDVILSLFWPEAEVGIYGTAATIFTLLLFLPRSFQLAIFPVLSRTYATQKDQLQSVYTKSIKFLVVVTFPIALFVSLFSLQIIQLVFGDGYEKAAPMLSILVWGFFISALNVSNSRLLIAANKQRIIALFAILSMVGNILLSLLLVPKFGGVGTAWARVLAMPLFTIPAIIYVQKTICQLDWHEFLRFDPHIFRFKSEKGL